MRYSQKQFELEKDGFGASIAMQAGYDPHLHLDILSRVCALRMQRGALDVTAFESKLPDLDNDNNNAALVQLKRLAFETTGAIFRIWPQEIIDARIESLEQANLAHLFEGLIHAHWVLPRVHADLREDLEGKPWWLRWWMQFRWNPLKVARQRMVANAPDPADDSGAGHA